jgi:hypothetical protein
VSEAAGGWEKGGSCRQARTEQQACPPLLRCTGGMQDQRESPASPASAIPPPRSSRRSRLPAAPPAGVVDAGAQQRVGDSVDHLLLLNHHLQKRHMVGGQMGLSARRVWVLSGGRRAGEAAGGGGGLAARRGRPAHSPRRPARARQRGRQGAAPAGGADGEQGRMRRGLKDLLCRREGARGRSRRHCAQPLAAAARAGGVGCAGGAACGGGRSPGGRPGHWAWPG